MCAAVPPRRPSSVPHCNPGRAGTRFHTLSQWLSFQEQLHPATIDLELERCAVVAGRMGLMHPSFAVVCVSGTNGKGSCVAFMEAILGAAGYQVGAYCSPHVMRYNERVRVAGEEVDDEALMESFEAVERHRDGVPLTAFEFGTLAAMWVFHRRSVDVALLEVGLGGRLDAVNLFDSDVAVVMPVSIDHTDWLGRDRETIGLEKAGILRAGRPVVCAEAEPPRSVRARAESLRAQAYRLSHEFELHIDDAGWRWSGAGRVLADLPMPSLHGAHQLRNAAAAIMALTLLPHAAPTLDAVRHGVAHARLPGRFQVVSTRPEIIVDVAHNVGAAHVLAATLAARRCRGATHAVLAMLEDKDIEGVYQAMAGCVQAWYITGLAVRRGASSTLMARRLEAVVPGRTLGVYPDVPAAVVSARRNATGEDRILIFGSFHTAGQALEALDTSRSP